MKNGYYLSDEEIIRSSADRLTDEESKRLLCDMLFEFDRFCKENNLKYWLGGGTLLGAVRHRGFIPWDDDIDLFMPRDDFQKLLKYGRITSSIEIVPPAKRRGTIYHPFAYGNLHENTTVMISHTLKHNTGKGQFIDIFPLDNIPDGILFKKILRRILTLLQHLRNACVYRKQIEERTRIRQKIIRWLVRFSDGTVYAKVINFISRSCRNNSSELVGYISFSAMERYCFKRDWFSETIEGEFENHRYPIPGEYDAVLKKEYGNYMELPPESERLAHHHLEIYRKKGICKE